MRSDFRKIMFLIGFGFMILLSQSSYAIDYTSIKSGYWNDPTVWSPYGVPESGDNVTFASGDVITHEGNLTWSAGQISGEINLTVNGNFTMGSTASWNIGNTFIINTTGDFTNSIGGIGTSATTSSINVTGNLTVNGNLTIENGDINVGLNCTLNASGDVIANTANKTLAVSGTLTSSDITISNGGIVDVETNVLAAAITVTDGVLAVNGNLTKSGTLTVNDASSTVIIVGDYTSTGSSTTSISAGDVFVFGTTTSCTGNCSTIKNLQNWVTQSTPAATYVNVLSGSVVFETDGTSTFTVPSGITQVVAEAWGAGGKGGTANQNNTATVGAGGGAYASSVVDVSGGQNITITVGAGSTSEVEQGDNSSFGTSVIAEGGYSGGIGNTTTPASGGLASNSKGSVKFSGGSGGIGAVPGNDRIGGGGGSSASYPGSGGSGGTPTGGIAPAGGGAGGNGGNKASGSSGVFPGGGGGGEGRQSTDNEGGDGADGKVSISWSNLPYVNFANPVMNVSEASGQISVIINLSATYSLPVTIPFSVSGSASGGSDYTLHTSDPITIPAGNTTATIQITIIDDISQEPDETIIITLGTLTNAVFGSASQQTITIYDNDIPPPDLKVDTDKASITICQGSSITFTSSPPDGGCAAIQDYFVSTDNVTWTQIFNSQNCNNNYTPPSSGTFFYRYYYYANANKEGYSNFVTVVVNPQPSTPGSISGTPDVIQGQTGVTYTVAAVSNAASYSWSYTDGTGATINGTENTTTIDFANDATSGNLSVQAVNSCGTSASSPTYAINVYTDVTAGTIAADQSICFNTAPSTLTETVAPSGGSGTYTYQWQKSPDNSTWTDILGATSSTFSPGALTATTYYRRQDSSGSIGPKTTNSITITVSPLATYGDLTSGDQTLNAPADPANITFSTPPSSGLGTISYQWYYQDGIVSCPTGTITSGWTSISGATASNYDPPSGLTASRTYAVQVTGTNICSTPTWANGCRKVTVEECIDVETKALYSDFCPQFLPPVSFNNDDDPRPPGRTELNYVIVPLNATDDWQFGLDFDFFATPGISETLSIDSLAVIENDLEIDSTGGVYTVDATTDSVFVNAFVVNQPGHSLDVEMDVINVSSLSSGVCDETVTSNNSATITIYPMPAIGKFE
ncbi:MAG: hypothetical protein K9G70_08035 [Prolixibacteraceae bacterium]|nr:hypothetical protein [Prolixibacteraceae bacterium]